MQNYLLLGSPGCLWYGIFVSIMATSATKKCQTQQRLPLDAHFGPIHTNIIRHDP